MYMAFPLHGGLVEWCHTAAQGTHPAFGLFTREKKKVVSPTFRLTFVSICIALL